MARFYKHPPDGGYGWVVLFASHVNLIIAGGIVSSLGMFVPEFMDDLDGVTDSVVTFITSLAVGLTLGLGPLSSQLMLRFGCRTVVTIGGFIAMTGYLITSMAPGVLALTFGIGILGGIGLGLVFVPSLAIIGCYFTTNYVKANAIASAGVGLGSMLFPVYFHWLIDMYGWRGAALITGGTCLQICVFGALIRPICLEQDNTSDYQCLENDIEDGNIQNKVTDQKDVAHTEVSELLSTEQMSTLNEGRIDTIRQHIKRTLNRYIDVHLNFFSKTPLFFFIGFPSMFYIVSYFFFLLLLPKIVMDLDMQPSEAATILTISGLASTIMRVFHFPLITMVGAPPLLLFMLSLIILGLPMMALPLITFYPVILMAAVFIGLGIGTAIPLANVVAKEIVTTPRHHILAMGWLYLLQGSGCVFTGYFGGLLGELCGNFAVAVMAGGILNIFGVLLSVQLYRKTRTTHTPT